MGPHLKTIRQEKQSVWLGRGKHLYFISGMKQKSQLALTYISYSTSEGLGVSATVGGPISSRLPFFSQYLLFGIYPLLTFSPDISCRTGPTCMFRCCRRTFQKLVAQVPPKAYRGGSGFWHTMGLKCGPSKKFKSGFECLYVYSFCCFSCCF